MTTEPTGEAVPHPDAAEMLPIYDAPPTYAEAKDHLAGMVVARPDRFLPDSVYRGPGQTDAIETRAGVYGALRALTDPSEVSDDIVAAVLEERERRR